MKIPLEISKRDYDKYNKLLFSYLESDKEFEKDILKARRSLFGNKKIVFKSDDKVRLTLYPTLRSEGKKFKTKPLYGGYIGSPFLLKLDNEAEQVVKRYKFLRGWQVGVRRLICGDRFLISDEDNQIYLKVKNKKYSYGGYVSDGNFEEGVKIVMRSNITKNQLISWVKDNFGEIKKYLKDFDNSKIFNNRRVLVSRDRLVVYLHKYRNMTFDAISNLLEDNSTSNALQKAFNNFTK